MAETVLEGRGKNKEKGRYAKNKGSNQLGDNKDFSKKLSTKINARKTVSN